MKQMQDSASTDSSISTSAITRLVDNLKRERHRDSTRHNYYLVWRHFSKFFQRLDEKPTLWEERVTLYAGYLLYQGKKALTIKSYISAIKAVLWEDGHDLNVDRSQITALTKACRLINNKIFLKLPIQKNLLNDLLKLTDKHFLGEGQHYLAVLYKALFSAMYYGLLRVSEVAAGEHPVLVTDVHIADNKDKLMFVLRSSKTHSVDEPPQIVKINSQPLKGKLPDVLCPYSNLRQYIALRQPYLSESEPFFVFADRSPITPAQVRCVLKKLLKLGNLENGNYGTHSFRAGRALDMLNMGVSVETIKQIGRWRSNAVFAYLRGC